MIQLAAWAEEVKLIVWYERYIRCCCPRTRRAGLRFVNKERRRLGLNPSPTTREVQARFDAERSRPGWRLTK